MKYFKREYLDFDYKNEKLRKESELKWETACESYEKYFNTIKHKFSKQFLDLYIKYDGFHDAPINSINVENIEYQRCNIRININLNKKSYELIYKNVGSYNLHVGKYSDCFFETMRWGYGEFELLQSGCLNHKISCLGESEFDITCAKFYIKRSSCR